MRRLVGIDENGLGPQLGPLVVTGVLAQSDGDTSATIDPTLLDDSKKLVAHGDVDLAEAWARVLCPADSPAALVARVSLDDADTLSAPCPTGLSSQCWGLEHAAFHAPDALVERVRAKVRALEREGCSLVRVRSVLVCPSRLHDLIGGKRSIFHVDLESMERLLLTLREDAGDEIEAVCGKVGGLGKYLPHLRHITAPATIVDEARPRATYRFAGLGHVSFVQDADASEPLVAIASLVGKYLRELLMGTITRHYRQRDPSLEDVSGYHDPVTGRFVLATAKIRADESVPDRCFLRPRKPPTSVSATTRQRPSAARGKSAAKPTTR